MEETIAIILYEDRAGAGNRFGPHELIVKCACDICDVDAATSFAAIHRIDGRPLKGVSNVIKTLRNQSALLASERSPLIAVLDNDQIRTSLNLPAGASETEVVNAIFTPNDQPAYLTVILLRENIETILQVAKEVCKKEFDPKVYSQATEKKEIHARDLLFGKLAHGERAFRDCIRNALPSFEQAVQALATVLRSVYLATGPHQ